MSENNDLVQAAINHDVNKILAQCRHNKLSTEEEIAPRETKKTQKLTGSIIFGSDMLFAIDSGHFATLEQFREYLIQNLDKLKRQQSQPTKGN